MKINDFSKFRELGLIFFIVVICIAVQIRTPVFLTGHNMNNLFTATAILGILSVGMMMVLLTGGIDLSIGANLAFCGMVSALTVRNNPGIPPIVLVLEGAVIGAAIGFITGTLVARFSILPIIASLGMMNIMRGLTYLVSGGAWVSAYQMPDNFKRMATNSVLGINNLIIIAVAVYIIFYYFINFIHRTTRVTMFEAMNSVS